MDGQQRLQLESFAFAETVRAVPEQLDALRPSQTRWIRLAGYSISLEQQKIPYSIDSEQRKILYSIGLEQQRILYSMREKASLPDV